MTTAVEFPRPGVEVIEQIRSASPTIVRPALVAFVTGPAKEIIEVTTSDGLLNTKAKQGIYSQLPKTISQTAFPSPRGNIAEVNVEEATVKAFLLNGGVLQELERDPGESFLIAWNKASRATIKTKLLAAPADFELIGKTLVLAVDVPARLNTSEDTTITFGSDNPLAVALTADEIVAQINAAVGEDIATIETGASPRIVLTSTVYGARSSLTIRAGGSANSKLGFDASKEYRVEGAGFRGQDQNNNTTVTPWIEWFLGQGYVIGTSTTLGFVTSGTGVQYGLTDAADTFGSYAATLTFSGAGSIDLRIGDEFYTDGARPNSAFVMKVESARFKLGTINATLSTYDDHGKLITAVYDPSTVNTLYAAALWSPRYAWFKAHNLVYSLVPQPASLTGNTAGQPAENAIVLGSEVLVTTPLTLTGLTLKVATVIDGVESDEQTFTFSGPPFTDMVAVAAAIGTSITGLVASKVDGSDVSHQKLALATTRTGAGQAVTVKSTGTANAALGFSTSADTSDEGTDVEFRDVTALLQGTANLTTMPLMDDLVFKVDYSSDEGVTWGTKTYTFATDPATIDALIVLLNGAAGWTGPVGPDGKKDLVASKSSDNKYLVVATTRGGDAYAIKITLTGNTAATALGFVAGTDEDYGEDMLLGHTFKFQLNGRSQVYYTIFTSNSLVDAVAAINEAVEFPVAYIGGSLENKLELRSTLRGSAALVTVVDDITSEDANAALGFPSNHRVAVGTGRPNPDFMLDVSGNVVLGAELLRNQVTGTPNSPGSCDLYIQYMGLRLDVSPSAVKPGLISLSDVPTLQTVLDPITSENPLGLGMYFAMINASGLVCTCMGVDEISATEPYGTPIAYAKVANFIQAEEVYAMALLTHSESVAQIFMQHANFMSQAEQKGERIVFFNPPMPTRAVDSTMATGTAGSHDPAVPNTFTGDVNPSAALTAAGIDIEHTIPVDDDLFVEIVLNLPSGQETRNYSVQVVNGVVWTLRTTFASGENDDGFYSVTPLTESLVNTAWSMAIRGAPLLIPGSTLPDKDAIAQTVAAKAAVYKNRRMYYFFPDYCKATLGGVEEKLEAFYACAVYAGQVAAQPPQQGFTNLPVAGLTGLVGSNDYFSQKQLNIMASGGVFILVQDAPGGPVTCRHQLSTNMTSIETRELSITKVLDYCAKFLRVGLRNFIGTFNITQPFLDTLSTVIHGMLQFLMEHGNIISGEINNLIQSKEQPDTVLVDVTLQVPYPCNYIRLTLAI